MVDISQFKVVNGAQRSTKMIIDEAIFYPELHRKNFIVLKDCYKRLLITHDFFYIIGLQFLLKKVYVHKLRVEIDFNSDDKHKVMNVIDYDCHIVQEFFLVSVLLLHSFILFKLKCFQVSLLIQ